VERAADLDQFAFRPDVTGRQGARLRRHRGRAGSAPEAKVRAHQIPPIRRVLPLLDTPNQTNTKHSQVLTEPEQSSVHTQHTGSNRMNKLKIAVVLLADTATVEASGRMANGLTLAKEAIEAGDEVSFIFDGAATKWIAELASEEHKYHRTFEAVRERAGACVYCARAFKVLDQVEAAGVALLDDYKGHPSLRQLIADGYAVVTF